MSLVLVGLPPGLEVIIGLDLGSWQIKTPPTCSLSLKHLPPGFHLLTLSQPNQLDTRAICFFTGPDEDCVRIKWDREDEHFVIIDNDYYGGDEVPSFSWKDAQELVKPLLWHDMTDHIDPSLLSHIFGRDGPARFDTGSTSAYSDLGEATMVDIHFTLIDPRRLQNRETFSPAQVSAFAIDKTPLLSRLLDEHGNHRLLGEFQLAFIILSVGHCIEGYQQWARILQVVSASQPDLSIEFPRILAAQLESCEEGFLQDIIQPASGDMSVLWCLQQFQGRQGFEAIRRIVKRRTGWDLGEELPEPDEDLPVIVEL